MLPVFILCVVWVIDFGIARINKNRLQISADAAALAGSAMLPEETDVQQEAILFARTNFSDAKAKGPILQTDDIEIGNWDREIRLFTPDGEPASTVRVTTRRETDNGNPFQTYFAFFAGIDEFDLRKSAVAYLGAGQG